MGERVIRIWVNVHFGLSVKQRGRSEKRGAGDSWGGDGEGSGLMFVQELHEITGR